MYYEAYEAMYTQYRRVRQIKMSASVYYGPFRQTYCSSNISHIQYIREFVTGPVKMDQVGTQILTTFSASQLMIC